MSVGPQEQCFSKFVFVLSTYNFVIFQFIRYVRLTRSETYSTNTHHHIMMGKVGQQSNLLNSCDFLLENVSNPGSFRRLFE